MSSQMPRQVIEAISARSGGLCEAWIPNICTTGAGDIHHRKLRSRGGKHTVTNCIALCSACHSWCHRHVAEATDLGLIVSTYADPALVHVVRRGWPGLLNTDGTVQSTPPPWED